MRAFLAARLLLGTLAAARADDDASAVSDTDKREIQRVITGQIDAFGHDEGDRAFGFASPHIQGMFGDPEHFMEMVRRGYTPVYRPRSVDFGDLVNADGRIVQQVELVGPDGSAAQALYSMEREADGSWRIDGCVIVKSERVGA